jgi:CelD/BcsL family acetyltransferase involved in cellulose biosynthesis
MATGLLVRMTATRTSIANPRPLRPIGAASGAASVAGVRVALLTERAQFADLVGPWDALAERCDDQAFYRHGFLRLWLEQFAGDAALRILVGFDARGRLTAALPLLAGRSRLYGVPLREWRAAANDHSCRFDLLADDPPAAADAIVAFLRGRHDWDLLRLTDVPVDGRAGLLQQAAERAGLACGRWNGQESPYATLPPRWELFEPTLQRRFRASLRRRRSRLEALGRVSLEVVHGGADLQARLQEGLMLEASGWKGRCGTAIVQDPATHAFYCQLAEQAAARGELALWFLRLDGKAIAFDFALEHHGRLLLLKTAYDEQYARVSPGQLLVENELRDAVARGLVECDFLGDSAPAKLDWAHQLRPHQWIYLFRGSRGRLAHLMKFQLGPRLKALRQRRAAGLPSGPAPAGTHA